MLSTKKMFLTLAFLVSLVFTFGASYKAEAKSGGEYKSIVGHLKTKYRAKKVRIPMMWLARFAVRVVRPAGVKSFSVTMFEDLQFSRETLDREMQGAMRNSLGAEWNPIVRVRSREGQQVYMYMREAGASVKLMLVTIDKNQAAVIRAKFSPERLAEFINDPKIFGISLGDDEKPVEIEKSDDGNEVAKPKEVSEPKPDSEN